MLSQASAKLTSNKPEEAISLLLKIRLNPVSQNEQSLAYTVQCLLGDCYSKIANKQDIAQQYYLEAKKSAEKLKDLIKLGDIYHKIGLCNLEMGRLEEARKAFNSAIFFKTRVHGKDHISLALEYNGLGNSYFYKHILNLALDNYKRALAIADKANKYGTDNAMFDQNVAIAYAAKGDYDNALLYFNHSIDISKHLYGTKSAAITQVYLNLGVLFYQIGKPQKAFEFYNQAEAILKNDPLQKKGLGILYLNKGNIVTDQKDFGKALTYYIQALRILKDYYPNEHPTINTIYVNLGYIYENQGNNKEALKSLFTARKNDSQTPLAIKIDRNIAGIYDKMGKFSEARKYYLSSIAKAKQIPGQDQEVAFSSYKFGDFLNNHKKNGLEYLNNALNIFTKYFGNRNQNVALVYNFLGTYYTSNNRDYQKALAYYQKALISIDEKFSLSNILYTPVVKNAYPSFVYFDILQNKAITLMNWYRRDHRRIDLLKAAMSSGEQALTMLDNIRDIYVSDESKYAIRERSQKISLVLMEVASELNRTEKNPQYIKDAFRFSEKSRSAVMLSYLREIEARQIGKIPAPLQNYERTLNIDIADYQKFIFDQKQSKFPDKNKLEFFDNKLFQLNQKHDSLVHLIEKKYPSYYSLKYDKNVISIDDVASRLSRKQAFLEYYMSDTALFAFVITQKNQRILRTRMTTGIRNQINILRDQLTKVDPSKITGTNYALFVNAARNLYRILLEPFQNEIAGKDLIIVPDGELLYIPFDVLLTSTPKMNGLDYKSLPYLIKEHAVNYSASATITFGRKEKHERQAIDLGAFAPTYDKNYKYKNLVYGNKDSVMTLFPIPGALEEVNRASKIYKGEVIKGLMASEALFKAKAPNYNILHLSAHTIIDNENPMYSKLAFTPGIDNKEDGLLNTYELFNMNLNAELAILSACNTGNGKLQLGEGIISIARGFFYAGVPSVVMTLWSVEDYSSAELMELFYKHLSEGCAKDEALRLAKLDYLKQSDQLTAFPYYWAGYVNIGDNSPLEISRNKKMNYILSFAALILVLSSIYILRRKNK
ncbi:MAG: CHAT domain-containing protein [Bacteroidota bacterium]|nr:CHAT domain-containing protein [Bacteroidota bacterium]